MPIKYKVSECTNPAGAIGVDYACNRSVQERPMSAIQFVKQIEQDTSYTRADVVGVFTAMAVKIQEYLLAGQHVDLKDGVTNLGILSPGIVGKCFAQSEIAAPDFNPSTYIQGAKIRMRPSNELKNEFNLRAKVQRVPSDLMQ
jgi:hypothetical protein